MIRNKLNALDLYYELNSKTNDVIYRNINKNLFKEYFGYTNNPFDDFEDYLTNIANYNYQELCNTNSKDKI